LLDLATSLRSHALLRRLSVLDINEVPGAYPLRAKRPTFERRADSRT
jgi:hypothetical protein